MYGIQKIDYSHIFYFYDKNDKLKRACPATKNESIDSAKQYMRFFSNIVRCEKVTKISKEITEFYDKRNEDWYK